MNCKDMTDDQLIRDRVIRRAAMGAVARLIADSTTGAADYDGYEVLDWIEDLSTFAADLDCIDTELDDRGVK